MPKVSVNILTKNRPEELARALASVKSQNFTDYDVNIIVDGSDSKTLEVINSFKSSNFLTTEHQVSIGITNSRQEALVKSQGEFIAILDDDDYWIDKDKLEKQKKFLEDQQEFVLVGGGMQVDGHPDKFRPKTDEQIRSSMLFGNNFFTSTVMFRKDAAIKAGGFIKDNIDLAEDYDLWLRMGKLGKMYNFPEVFVNYRQPSYNKAKFKQFLTKQLSLIKREKYNYSGYFLASLIMKIRLLI
jgi:glycosyltransferase involved in cell wall biosynthesis